MNTIDMSFNTRKAGMDDLKILSDFTLDEVLEVDRIKLRMESILKSNQTCMTTILDSI